MLSWRLLLLLLRLLLLSMLLAPALAWLLLVPAGCSAVALRLVPALLLVALCLVSAARALEIALITWREPIVRQSQSNCLAVPCGSKSNRGQQQWQQCEGWQ